MKFYYSQIEDYCTNLYQVSKNIRNILDETMGEINKISNTEIWKGPAGDNYIEKLKGISLSFDNASAELESAVLFLASCADNYETLENNIIQEISNNLQIER